jgi:phosphoribosylanthranilate isomerase
LVLLFMSCSVPYPSKGKNKGGARMTLVKICGLTTADTVQAVSHLPIDYIGFVFAPSKRRVSVNQAAELTDLLHKARGESRRLLSAGVFVNPDWAELVHTVRSVELDVVQLHGDETPELCRRVQEELGVSVFKSLSIATGQTAGETASRLEPYRGTIETLLLDTYDPAAGGGTGKTFDWGTIPAYRAWTQQAGMKLMVAGGLHPDNVAELLDQYAVDGVDVSSGVETDGVKDIIKIQTFVERVKQHV